jgi:hypothetical protein
MKEMLQRGAVGVATLLAVDVLGGCTTAPPTETTPPSTTQIDPELERQTKYHEGPVSPCLSNYEPTIKEARACQDMQQNTRIALVNFGFTPEEAQEAARSMVVPFNRSTNGIFNAQPVVIPASEAAKKEAEARSTDCIDDFMDFASVAAQAEMPDALDGDKIDIVIALTKAQACDPSVAGMAEGARYADILAGGHPTMTPTELGYAAAHEAGHNVGLGHVSEMWCASNLGDQDPAAGPLNIDAYLQSCEENEYSDYTRSVMGDAFNKEESEFAAEPAQLPEIMWPQEVLEGDTGMVIEATPQGVSVGLEEAQGAHSSLYRYHIARPRTA